MPEDKKKPEDDNSPGSYVRNAAMLSAPTILITYPLVGFGLGWLGAKYWHWPDWIMLVTLLMGLVQGMREVYKLGMKLQKNDKK
jgi:F0F1-type ATP synthase assembly protein I